ncbi:MAG TPA: hypothetical protein PLF61_01810 [Candidatus Goldiibacteriota bacterium]|nr:hypothetical protein [Candidatus Goldiibacteriota bacterium]
MSNKEQKKQAQKSDAGKDEFTIKDYFYINVIFFAFLFVIAIIVFITAGGKWDPVMESAFGFIFIVFGGGFVAVSIFDYLYEKYAGKKDENQNQNQ